MKALTTLFALAFAGPVNVETATFKVGEESTSLSSMSVINLRDQNCGGDGTEGNQDAKNSKFIGCVMYVLGVVDMLREWQIIQSTLYAIYLERQIDEVKKLIIGAAVGGRL